MYLLCHSQHVHREEDGAVHFWRIKEIFRISSHTLLIGLTVSGKYAWLFTSTALVFQEQLFISELFRDIQDAILLILRYRLM